MQKRALTFLVLLCAASAGASIAAGCGGGNGETSEFDGGVQGTGVGTIADDAGHVGTGGGGNQSDATISIVTGGGGGGAGDGGTGGIDCDATPLACIPAVCGDSLIEPGETCDDGNAVSGDGCSSTCQLEGDYYACVPGILCKDVRNCEQLVEAGVLRDGGADSGCSAPPKVAVCGDGTLDPGEACDTGMTVGQAQSGCAADCSSIFQGFACFTPGQNCVDEWVCGDGKIEGAEVCDEGPVTTAGCASSCTVVTPGWSCVVAGTPCVATKCGDGIVAGSEQCDIGTVAQPGCSSTCQLQSQTVVVNPGTDGTQPSSKVINYSCAYAKTGDLQETCTPTVCGNGAVEGSEQCDDENNRAYDGCSPTCQREPSCHNNKDLKGNPIQDGTCVAVCGDGLLFDYDADGDGKKDEACDDGNTISGDGCSSTCTVEPGYACTAIQQPAPAFVDVPVVYRDMLYSGTMYQAPNDATSLVYGHPDFQVDAYSQGVVPDLTLVGLSAGLVKGKPPFAAGIPIFGWNGAGLDPFNTSNTHVYPQELTSTLDFTDWYQELVNPDGATGASALSIPRSVRVDGQYVRMTAQTYQGSTTYIFDSNCDEPYGYGTYSADGAFTCAESAPPKGTTLGGFFPIDGEGWNAITSATTPQVNNGHNFSFTTQFRYYFTFNSTQSATLTFTGDDDVWVYLDGQRVVDIGGVHSAAPGTYTLDQTQSLGLVSGHVYEVDLFNAERHTTGSNFRLALAGFVKRTSSCMSVCGDGIRTPNEQCDNGTDPAHPDGSTTNDKYNTNDGDYDTCTAHTATIPGCTLGPYCGDDKVTTPPEVCDNGVNATAHAPSAMAAQASCAPGCVEPAYCGDKLVQNAYGEQCDDGSQNNDSTYGGCTTQCALGPRCGDDVVQSSAGEACDNGLNATPYVQTLKPTDCAPGCKIPVYCGNGTVDVPYELCDNGANNSDTGAYNSCTTKCEPGPHCGDGILQSPPEQCDDGNLINGDGCSAACLNENTGIR